LAKRGWKVTVIDKNTIASGASGNAQGVLYAKLSAEMNLHSQFYLSGYLFSLQQLKTHLPDKQDWNNCGVLQLATNEKEEKRQATFYERHPMDEVVKPVTAKEASGIAGCQIDHPGLFFKDGAWVHPKSWCERLLDHKNITLMDHCTVTSLSYDPTNGWQVEINSESTLQSDIVVICNGDDAKRFTSLDFLPTKPVSGQVTQIPHQDIQLKTVLCGDHYVTPTHNRNLNFGASYRLNTANCDVLNEENQSNLDNLSDQFPSVAAQLSDEYTSTGRASVRCTSPDYTPIVGAVCDAQHFQETFTALKKNRKWRFETSAKYQPGLYLNIAHGSRGLSSAPLSAELIIASITGEPIPMPKAQMDMLSPNRCLVNKVIKS